MKPVLTIREENVEVPLDEFYGAIHAIIDQANPDTHLCHRTFDPLHLGLVLYPVRVYETIRKLKEQQNVTSGDR